MRRWKRTFSVEGLNVERLLRMAGERGILIVSVKRKSPKCIVGEMLEDDLPRLQELAGTGGWRLAVGRRHGTGAVLDRLQRRWMIPVCVMAGAMALLLATQVVWRIEIIDGGTYEADIRQALEAMDVRPMMLRRQVNLADVRDSLEWRYPRIAWIECGWRGMALSIRVVEGVLPLETGESDGSCDIVAARDGIVSSIVTRAGTPVVAPGDLVRNGQVLIRGEERTSDGLTRSVAARGSVYARVWDAAAIETSLYQVETIYTGRTQQAVTVRTPWFDLWRAPDSGFAQQDTAVRELPLGGFFLPLTIRMETRMEAECSLVLCDIDAAKVETGDAAMEKLYEIVGGKESLVDNWVNWSMIEDEILLSVAYGERLIDIAQQQRTPVMAAAE